MIRINLLASERRQAKSAPKGLLLAQKMTVIGSLILVLAALGVGWRYWALGQQAAGIERQLADARREEQRLAGIGCEDAAHGAGLRRIDLRLAFERARLGTGEPGLAIGGTEHGGLRDQLRLGLADQRAFVDAQQPDAGQRQCQQHEVADQQDGAQAGAVHQEREYTSPPARSVGGEGGAHAAGVGG